MLYPVSLTPDGGNILVTFPDVPEAITQGEDEQDALSHAADALETALDFYFDEKRPVPKPSKAKRGQHTVELPASVAATVLLYNEMLEQAVRPAELAKRMNVPRQDITRLLDRKHNTKIDTIATALKAVGRRLELSVST